MKKPKHSREIIVNKMLELIRRDPGVRPRELHKMMGLEHSTGIRNALIKQGLVRKESRGTATHYFPIVEKVVVVDEQDKIIGYKDRNLIDRKDIYRATGLWITDSEGKILLARRALNKSHNPGQWGPAVAGTVEKGESRLKNIIKEAEEEIGLKNIKPRRGLKTRTSGKYNYFAQWYFLELNKPVSDFNLNRKEVDKVRWFSKSELLRKIKENPENFLKSMEKHVKLFCKT